MVQLLTVVEYFLSYGRQIPGKKFHSFYDNHKLPQSNSLMSQNERKYSDVYPPHYMKVLEINVYKFHTVLLCIYMPPSTY